jgi:hypothetical protein
VVVLGLCCWCCCRRRGYIVQQQSQQPHAHIVMMLPGNAQLQQPQSGYVALPSR